MNRRPDWHHRPRRIAATALLAATLLSAGCASRRPPLSPAPPDPEAKSGPDARRSGAIPIRVRQRVADEVSFPGGDRTDWKSLALDRTGSLLLDLRWDEPGSDLDLAVFDAVGGRIDGSPIESRPGRKRRRASIGAPGSCFVRIQAIRPGDRSTYVLEATWQDEVVSRGDGVRTRTRPRRENRGPAMRSVGEAVQGRIVSSYRESGSLVLHIDKGANAGIRPGQSGSVLEGPAGESPVEGGALSVTHVIDDARSIGRTALRSLGRNTRVSIRIEE